MTEVDVTTTLFSVTITATTQIAAPPEQVWAMLTNFSSYPEWNPFVRRIEGDLQVGEKLTVDLQPGESKPQTMRPAVVEVEPGRTFTWLGHVGLPGVLDGRHTFTVEPAGAGTRLVQHERLSGALAPLFRSMLVKDTPRAFAASNDALAARVLTS
jgi:hypothetical protein